MTMVARPLRRLCERELRVVRLASVDAVGARPGIAMGASRPRPLRTSPGRGGRWRGADAGECGCAAPRRASVPHEVDSDDDPSGDNMTEKERARSLKREGLRKQGDRLACAGRTRKARDKARGGDATAKRCGCEAFKGAGGGEALLLPVARCARNVAPSLLPPRTRRLTPRARTPT